MTNVQNEIKMFFLKGSFGCKKETSWHPKKGYDSKKSIIFPSLTSCLDMEHFVFVPTSAHNNKCSIIQTVAKQKLPYFEAERNSTYRTDRLKKELKKTLFAEEDSSVDKILSCSRVKLSNSVQTLLYDGEENEVMLSDFAQQLPCKNTDVPDIYFALLDLLVYIRIWF